MEGLLATFSDICLFLAFPVTTWVFLTRRTFIWDSQDTLYINYSKSYPNATVDKLRLCFLCVNNGQRYPENHLIQQSICTKNGFYACFNIILNKRRARSDFIKWLMWFCRFNAVNYVYTRVYFFTYPHSFTSYKSFHSSK